MAGVQPYRDAQGRAWRRTASRPTAPSSGILCVIDGRALARWPIAKSTASFAMTR